jgi:ABC-type uncharacterized transport system permease subunit
MNTPTKLKEIDFLKAWAVFWVLSTVGGTVVGFVAGAMLGFVLGGLGVHMRTIQIVCGGLGFLLGIPISYFLFQFSIRMFLVPKLSPPEATALPNPPAYSGSVS